MVSNTLISKCISLVKENRNEGTDHQNSHIFKAGRDTTRRRVRTQTLLHSQTNDQQLYKVINRAPTYLRLQVLSWQNEEKRVYIFWVPSRGSAVLNDSRGFCFPIGTLEWKIQLKCFWRVSQIAQVVTTSNK